jgi:Holliday junction resolvase RusA-like endonuclease
MTLLGQQELVESARDAVEFVVYGVAKPGGSKRAFRHPHTGRIVVTEDSRNRSWRQEVAEAGREAFGPGDPWTFALAVEFTFYRPRPKGHYGSGRNAGVVKTSAPAWPGTRPDVLKLARAVEDSLTGIVWRDDAQIVDERLCKVWGEPERVVITIRLLEVR